MGMENRLLSVDTTDEPVFFRCPNVNGFSVCLSKLGIRCYTAVESARCSLQAGVRSSFSDAAF